MPQLELKQQRLHNLHAHHQLQRHHTFEHLQAVWTHSAASQSSACQRHFWPAHVTEGARKLPFVPATSCLKQLTKNYITRKRPF